MEYLLFLKDTYYLTQGYGDNSFSHKGRYALDFSSRSGNKKVYAPFNGYVARIYVKKNHAYTVWLVSNKKVLCADGKKHYVVCMITHPKEIANMKVNQKFKQGDYILNDGRTGYATGDHIDIEIAIYDNKKDIKTTWYLNKGNYRLTNSVNPCKYMVIKDSTKVAKKVDGSKSFEMKKIGSIFKKGEYKTLYNMNVRKGPSTKNKKVGSLKKGKTFKATKIIYNNKNDIWAKYSKGYINIVNNANLNCTYK